MKAIEKYSEVMMKEAKEAFENREITGFDTLEEALKAVQVKYESMLTLTNPKEVAGILFKENRPANSGYSKDGNLRSTKEMQRSFFIFKYIADNSKSFHEEIAEKAMDETYFLSDKQVWSLAYEYVKLINNL